MHDEKEDLSNAEGSECTERTRSVLEDRELSSIKVRIPHIYTSAGEPHNRK